MPQVTECWGCGEEIDMRNDTFHKQPHNRVLCRFCNKVYFRFEDKAQPIYAEIDRLREKKLEDLKKDVFLGFKTSAESENMRKGYVPLPGEVNERVNSVKEGVGA